MKDRRVARLIRQNLKFARNEKISQLTPLAVERLREMTTRFGFSLHLGDLVHLDGGWYVTHAGLLRLAARRRCVGIEVLQVLESCNQSTDRWVFRATIYKSPNSKGFTGYGDADPSNTSPLVRGAEMRVAETRAINRALRKAYGIGLCSVEELGWLSGSSTPTKDATRPEQPPHRNGTGSGQPRLRDRLCVLIRQYNLDPTLVKAYAADFCRTPTLREANRELVESFISHLAASVQESRDALICRLNSYAQPEEVKP